MATLNVELDLTDRLAKDAEAAGLLEPRAIERLMREAMRRRAMKRFLSLADRVAAARVPSLAGSRNGLNSHVRGAAN